MTVKTITVTEEAYNTMRHLKGENESFSQLFERLGKNKGITFKDIVGILKHTPEEAEAFAHRVHEYHKSLGKGMEARIADVRARLERSH